MPAAASRPVRKKGPCVGSPTCSRVCQQQRSLVRSVFVWHPFVSVGQVLFSYLVGLFFRTSLSLFPQWWQQGSEKHIHTKTHTTEDHGARNLRRKKKNQRNPAPSAENQNKTALNRGKPDICQPEKCSLLALRECQRSVCCFWW